MFYYLLAGAEERERQAYMLGKADSYNYLSKVTQPGDGLVVWLYGVLLSLHVCTDIVYQKGKKGLFLWPEHCVMNLLLLLNCPNHLPLKNFSKFS